MRRAQAIRQTRAGGFWGGPARRQIAATSLGGWALLGLALVAAGAAEEPAEGWVEANVALGAEFTESGATHRDWNGLTDGVKDSDVSPACYATTGEQGLPKWVLLDLGRPYDVTQINVYNSLNGNTKTVALYVGASSTKLTCLWKHEFPDRHLRTFQQQFPKTPIRYVKLVFEDTYGGGFGGDSVLYLREVEVIARVRQDEGTDGVRPGVAESAVVVSFPRTLRLLRRLTLARRFPLTVLVGGTEALAPERWTGSLRGELARAFEYEPRDPLAPRAVSAVIRDLGETTNAAPLVRAARRDEADLVVLALRPEDAAAVTGAALVSSLTSLGGELTSKTDCVVVLALLPTPERRDDSPLRAALGQLRAAARQVGYLADVGVLDCENAVEAVPERRPDLFDAEGKLNDLGRSFVARTLSKALRDYGAKASR